MFDPWQFWILLGSMIGVFVTLLLMILKIKRKLLTKEYLNKITEDFCLEIKYGFKKVNQFEEAAVDREKIRMEMREEFAKAAVDREKIRMEMKEEFAEAAADREKIRTEMKEGFAKAAVDREKIRRK